MDSGQLLVQTDLQPACSEREVSREAGLHPVSQAELVGKQRPETRAEFLRSLRQVERFGAVLGGAQLRAYQQRVAQAVADSVLERRGLSLVVMFPRQSGKNFLQAQLEVYFLVRFARVGAEMIKFSPTFEPQSLNAMRRLEAALQANWLTRDAWKKSSGNHYRFGNAHLTFLSAAPGANVVGATAGTLLELDEAQDIEIDKYDKQIAPMAASTNATRVFWGTAWTEQTLLERELRLAEEAQAQDGLRRVFRLSAEDVRKEVPAYGVFVDEQVARLGRAHPMVRSQFFSEEISTEGGLFPPARLGLMQGSHPARELPEPGKLYALLVDLAGEDEAMRQGTPTGMEQPEGLTNPGRDATAITVVDVDLHLQAEALVGKPIYKVMQRYLWKGEKHSTQYARLLALVERWQPQRIVVDASGVGAGVASFLADRFGERVIQLRFTQQVKSRLGWGFLAVVDTGRFQDHLPSDAESEADRLQALFKRQLAGVSYRVSNGPEHLIAWGVPDSARDPQNGGLLHDDLVLSAAMVAELDAQPWSMSHSAPLVIAASDPIKEMDGGF